MIIFLILKSLDQANHGSDLHKKSLSNIERLLDIEKNQLLAIFKVFEILTDEFSVRA